MRARWRESLLLVRHRFVTFEGGTRAAPQGALSLFVTEAVGQAPVRVEEILVCDAAVGAEG